MFQRQKNLPEKAEVKWTPKQIVLGVIAYGSDFSDVNIHTDGQSDFM